MPRHSPYALISLNFHFFNGLGSLHCLSIAILSLLGFQLVFEKTSVYPPFVLLIVIIVTTTFGKTNKFYIIASLISVRFLYSVVNDLFVQLPMKLWLAQVDSNHRPRAYQARALTS